MSLTFTKLFSSITESTVWCEPAHTRLVWITMLAMADRKGRVWASVPGLANRARVPLEDTEKALATFLAPDRYSRTPDHEGRRIEPIDGGWKLLNHEKYRDMRDEETRRDQNREAQARHREKSAKPLTVSQGKPKSAQADAEAEELKPRAGRGTRLPADWKPTLDLQDWAAHSRPDLNARETVERFRDYWTSVPGAKGLKLDWDATFRNWVRGEKRQPGAKPAAAETPTITCSVCKQKARVWTAGKCDPCWRKEQGIS